MVAKNHVDKPDKRKKEPVTIAVKVRLTERTCDMVTLEDEGVAKLRKGEVWTHYVRRGVDVFLIEVEWISRITD